ncbi:hypothetical protein HMPREF0813_01529 [Streptococcus anginosus F0211]|uniref:Uncharacterized protein n=2 Tax=Streptococcus anginosus TaxID=1328 RepID=E6J2N9_STRAP|nr:hypothetical protein HMPREF0813_01529 [Streptococcus anginosus F0211]EJP25647.1 hypothetical protein HMPREF1126_0717 [Streptococcus anginosus SK1138]ETS96576.1 hypothetical protein HMPREF1512_0853 [Streptococcus sp. OBRC6]EUC76640.1 hypothetical protein HMPREF1511_0626 [Streptococcus sp. CM7]
MEWGVPNFFGSIISVVGNTTAEIMEPFFYHLSSNSMFFSQRIDD